MISTNSYKKMEYCLLFQLQRKITLGHHQFAYRLNTSTLLATALLKDSLHNYVNHRSTVYACFLDMSKAYERVLHTALISKMRKLGVPDHLVSIFECIFASSFIKVNYNGSFSSYWQATCGVRQSGVTSAVLFSIYIDDILSEVGSQPHACSLGYCKLNVLAHTDDVVLLCSLAIGQRILIRKVESLVNDNYLVLNADETKTMVFHRAPL